jgi:UDPglucose 6-dehydrogenase
LDPGGQEASVLGLIVKPNTNDMRDAPSFSLVHALVERGAEVVAFDRVGREVRRRRRLSLMPSGPKMSPTAPMESW